MRHGHMPVGGVSPQDLAQFRLDRKAHVIQSIGYQEFHNLNIPSLNFSPLKPPYKRRGGTPYLLPMYM